MYDKNQLVEMKWVGTNRQYYQDKGYVFTNYNDVFQVKVKDLPLKSNKIIIASCDYCGKKYSVQLNNYNKSTKNGIFKCSCSNQECMRLKEKDVLNMKFQEDKYKQFVENCYQKGYTPISTKYINAHTKLKYLCPIHGIKKITPTSLNAGNGCKECANQLMSETLSKSIKDVIKIVESKNNNKLLNPNEYIDSNTSNLKIRCGSCSQIFTTSLGSICHNSGKCKNCGAKQQSLTKTRSSEEIKDIINSVNNNILLNSDDYIKSDVRNMKVLCGSCQKNIYITSVNDYVYSHQIQCRECSNQKSTGELLISNILDKYQIDYVEQKTFSDLRDIKLLSFDFFIITRNILIEFNGEQHYKPVCFNGITQEKAEDRLIIQQKHDKMKKEYCESHNLSLIVIPYWELNNIEQILIKELNLQQIA